MSASLNWEDAYRVQAEGVKELRRENAALRNEIVRLNNQTMWVCSCGGTDCAGREENAALRKALEEAFAESDDTVRFHIIRNAVEALKAAQP